MDVTDALTHRGRVRVLDIILMEGEVNISHLARKAGMDHNATSGHVDSLVELGLVRERRVGRERVIMPCVSSVEIRFEKRQGMRVTVQ
ncbi:MAG: winged helix-turn-helix domain-containing protein [Candidatus Bathyarchaeota archaeon]|nr:winged helix-turn-helix domain-containing protein [Candidatus Bathyarchaeota archaeon]